MCAKWNTESGALEVFPKSLISVRKYTFSFIRNYFIRNQNSIKKLFKKQALHTLFPCISSDVEK